MAAESDPMLAYMIQRGMPLTREQLINLSRPDGPLKAVTAPVASGWSCWPAGLAPAGKRCLCTAHT